MDRLSRRTIALGLLFAAVTIPVFAFVCRGRTPTRFDFSNLPSWEQQSPPMAAMKTSYRFSPPSPGSLRLMDRSQVVALERVDLDALFAAQKEQARAGSAKSVASPGLWLREACAFGRQEPALNGLQDQVVLRLMTEQQPDGYFGHGNPDFSSHPAALTYFAQNLDGLLAYYRLKHSLPAIYAAMRAGDLAATMTCSTTGRKHGYHLGPLRHPLIELYAATGDSRYLNAVIHAADTPEDGLTLAALYRATGKPEYLNHATKLWTRARSSSIGPSCDFSAEMLKLTGQPCYATALSNETPDPASLEGIVFTSAPGGIAANCRADSECQLGDVHIVQHPDRDNLGTRLTMRLAKPATFSLRVFVPHGPVRIGTMVDSGPPQILINNKPQRIVPQPGQYATLTKTWRDGDTVALLPTKPTITASDTTPAVHTDKLLGTLRKD